MESTAECISPYCIWSLKDPAHHIPNQTEIATKEFCPKSLLRKQNEIDSIESHFQINQTLMILTKSKKFWKFKICLRLRYVALLKNFFITNFQTALKAPLN